MKIQRAVALRLTELLLQRNMTQAEISVKSGLTKQAISLIMNEKHESVKFETLIKLADGFNITVQEFIDSKYFERENLDIKYE